MPDPELSDMSPKEFREWGHRSIDWIADYFENLETTPVLPKVTPGSIRAQIPDAPPETSESMDAIFRDLNDVILPGVTHWNSPNFFAYFSMHLIGSRGYWVSCFMAALNNNANALENFAVGNRA